MYPVGTFEHAFLTLQKGSLLSKGALDICTRAGPKTLPKKVQQKLERGRGGEPLPAAWALKIDGF